MPHNTSPHCFPDRFAVEYTRIVCMIVSRSKLWEMRPLLSSREEYEKSTHCA